MSSPDADSKTSESAAWNITSVFLGSEPAPAVERLVPRSASIGSTRVAIHAGAMLNASPVNSDVINANSRIGTEGDALMGTLANPAYEGNAKWRIKRVPTNAMPTPAAPPNNESKMLSVRGCVTTREVWAPSAMLTDKHEVGNIGADDQQHKS